MDRDASLRKLLKEVKIARNYIISTKTTCNVSCVYYALCKEDSSLTCILEKNLKKYSDEVRRI